MNKLAIFVNKIPAVAHVGLPHVLSCVDECISIGLSTTEPTHRVKKVSQNIIGEEIIGYYRVL